MKFVGISKNFSTIKNNQYDEIGFFWDEMSQKYGLENLIGLGYKWENNTIDYAIGLKSQEKIPGSNFEFELPDENDKNWIVEKGKTEELDKIYEKICKNQHHIIRYELETFYNDGSCVVTYYKNK